MRARTHTYSKSLRIRNQNHHFHKHRGLKHETIGEKNNVKPSSLHCEFSPSKLISSKTLHFVYVKHEISFRGETSTCTLVCDRLYLPVYAYVM